MSRSGAPLVVAIAVATLARRAEAQSAEGADAAPATETAVPSDPAPALPLTPPAESGQDASAETGSATVWVIGPSGPAPQTLVSVTLVYIGGLTRVIALRTGAEGWVRLLGLPVGRVRTAVASGPGTSHAFTPPPRGGYAVVLRAQGAVPGLLGNVAAADTATASADEAVQPPAASGADPARPAGTLTAWVLDPSGPVGGANVRVDVYPIGGTRLETSGRTGPSGFVRFRGLPTRGVQFTAVTGETTATERIPSLEPNAYTAVLRTDVVLGSIRVEGGRFELESSRSDATVASPVSPAPIPYRRFSLEDASVLYESASTMQTAGVALTLFGAGFIVLGSSIAAGAFGYPHDPDDVGAFVLYYMASLAVGMAGLGVGIPCWAIGGYRMGKAERMGYQPGLD
jgi:hypothetical protein